MFTKGRKRPVRIYELYEKIEKPCAKIFAQMSDRGICVDLTTCEGLKKNWNERSPIEEYITNELGTLNLNSPKQLLGALNAKGINPIA